MDHSISDSETTGQKAEPPAFKPVDKLSSELRISPIPVFAALPFLGMLFYGLAETWLNARELFPFVLFALYAYLSAGAGLLILSWKGEAARVWAVAAAGTFVYLAAGWLQIPGALSLAAVPPVLAVSLISFRAGVIAAVLETLLSLWLGVGGRLAQTELSIQIIEIWAVFGAVIGIHRPAQGLARWSWDYFTGARRLLEEARDRQGDLARALSDLSHANQQLTRINALAQSLRQAAEDARLAKEQFVANVSHELRTPLNMIIGFSEMILDAPETYGDGVPPALLADLSIVRRNAEHLAELIDDVLDLSQIEADQMALTREYVPFEEILASAADAVRPLYRSRRLFLKTEIEDGLPPVLCDRTRIREVLLNLLSNAGRFTEQGGVVVRARREHDALAVSVTDTGPGIAAENLQKLFQPFQQLDGSIRRRYGGTGLGLNISKRFIELHGGKIWAESQPGSGTTFHFRLPLAQPRPAASSVTRWLVPEWDFVTRPPDPASPKETVRPRIVVADTGDTLERLLDRYFGDAEVVAASSVEEALREVAAIPSQALIINDQAAHEVIDRLDASVLPYELPVIACSVPGTEEMAANLDATGYLVKPVAKEAMLQALDRLDLPNKTVLIVDDEPEALRLFQRMLHSAGQGYRVLRARNGQEALRILQQVRPDVILMDLVMPNMDGFQFLRERRSNPDLRSIPVIITSARDPFGQPVVTRSLAVTRKGGISVHALMNCVQAVTQILAMPGQPGGPG